MSEPEYVLQPSVEESLIDFVAKLAIEIRHNPDSKKDTDVYIAGFSDLPLITGEGASRSGAVTNLFDNVYTHDWCLDLIRHHRRRLERDRNTRFYGVAVAGVREDGGVVLLYPRHDPMIRESFESLADAFEAYARAIRDNSVFQSNM